MAAWAAPLLVAALALVPVASAPAALAQQAPAAEAAAEPAAGDLDDLRSTLEDRYRALPAVEGVLLVPREELPGIQSIEVSDGRVAVNGEVLSPGILRSWLGDEAEPLLRLAALDPAESRELLTVEAAPEAEEAVSEEEVAEDATETGEGVEDELPEPPEPPAAPAPPDEPRIQLGQQFTMGDDVVIEKDEVATEAVAIGGSVIVYGKVRRDVVAVGGRVEVIGEVGGEIVSVLGGVAIGPEGRVGGNVTAVGGGVQRAPGARIEGQISELSAPYFGPGDFDWEEWSERRDRPFTRHWKVQDAYWNLVGAVLIALLVCLALLIGRGPVERAERRIHSGGDFLLAGAVGLGIALLLVPVLAVVTVLLVVTIVGCLALPLIPFALLALVVATLFGYAGVALRIGRWCEQRFGWSFEGPYVPALLGVALIQVWRLLGEGLDVVGGPAVLFAAMFFFVGVLVEFVAWMVALGAIAMNLVDRRGARPPAGAMPPGPPPGALPPPPAGHPGGPPTAPPSTPPTPAAPGAGADPAPQPPGQPGASVADAEGGPGETPAEGDERPT